MLVPAMKDLMILVETSDRDNDPNGRWSADEPDGADSPEGYQIAKDRFLEGVKGPSRKRQLKSLVAAHTERITTAT